MAARGTKARVRGDGPVMAAAAFKAEALAVMRRVNETSQAVTITSRGKPLVRIEPVARPRTLVGYGSMRGTVELLVPDEALFEGDTSGEWQTLEEWDEVTKT